MYAQVISKAGFSSRLIIPRELIDTSRQRAGRWQRCASKAEAVKKGIHRPFECIGSTNLALGTTKSSVQGLLYLTKLELYRPASREVPA
jgi:hypothetical protein